MGIKTMFGKIVKICIASVLFLAGCSSKVSASSASITGKAKTEINNTPGEKPVKKSNAAEKKEQPSGAKVKTEKKKANKKSEAKSEVSGKSNTKKASSQSQSQKSADTSSAQASGSNKTKAAKNSTASSEKTKPAESSQHVHSWEYVKPTSHSETRTVIDKEAWDETVIDVPEWDEPTEWIVCNGCGYKTQDRDEFMDHAAFSEASPGCGAYHVDTEYIYHPAVTHTVHHDAVTHEITVEVADGFGYYKCSCGATKEGW